MWTWTWWRRGGSKSVMHSRDPKYWLQSRYHDSSWKATRRGTGLKASIVIPPPRRVRLGDTFYFPLTLRALEDTIELSARLKMGDTDTSLDFKKTLVSQETFFLLTPPILNLRGIWSIIIRIQSQAELSFMNFEVYVWNFHVCMVLYTYGFSSEDIWEWQLTKKGPDSMTLKTVLKKQYTKASVVHKLYAIFVQLITMHLSISLYICPQACRNPDTKTLY